MIAAIAAFLLSLAPLVAVGLHSRMMLDDYVFSSMSLFAAADSSYAAVSEQYVERGVRHALQNGNAADFARAVWHTIRDNYYGWQGTFSAIAVFALHPAVLFGEAAYPVTMIFTLGMLILSTAFLFKTLLRKYSLLPCIGFLFLTIQWLPAISDAFYWWNGATYYTTYYSIFLFSLSFKIRLFRGAGCRRFAVKLALLAALDFLIGGGNYVTALLNAELNVLCLAAFVLLHRKRLKEHSRKIAAAAVFSAAALLGLLISALAPGNAVRGEFAPFNLGAAQAVWISIIRAADDIRAWTTPPVFSVLVLSLPLIWRLAKSIRYDFRLPLLVSAVSFLLFASQNTPPIYAISYAGDLKLRDIVYYSYLWLLFGNVFI